MNVNPRTDIYTHYAVGWNNSYIPKPTRRSRWGLINPYGVQGDMLLSWDILYLSPMTFQVVHLAWYILDLSLLDAAFVPHSASMKAAAALALARDLHEGDVSGKPVIWSPTMTYYTGYNSASLRSLMGRLAQALVGAPTSKQAVSRNSYWYFTNCCHTKHEGVITSLTLRNPWVYYCYVKIPQCGYIVWSPDCNVQKHMAPLAICYITMTSQWAGPRLKSPASRLFTQPFIRAQFKENIKAPRHWPLCGEFTGDRWIPRTNGQ